jgi:hypothetical protein
MTSATRIPFSLRGLDGYVDVSLSRNADPASLGYLLLSGGEPVDFARDFPVCRATVTYPAPYAWYGLKPEFFDAPSRGDRYDMDWEAHAFLCVAPDAVVTPVVQAVAGFRWGFTVTGPDIAFVPPTVLGSPAWEGHLDLLRASYPAWAFDAGYGRG